MQNKVSYSFVSWCHHMVKMMLMFLANDSSLVLTTEDRVGWWRLLSTRLYVMLSLLFDVSLWEAFSHVFLFFVWKKRLIPLASCRTMMLKFGSVLLYLSNWCISYSKIGTNSLWICFISYHHITQSQPENEISVLIYNSVMCLLPR